MKKLLLPAVVLISISTSAQNITASNIIEGGKTLVELVRVFKSPKDATTQHGIADKKDSCSIKNTADLCIKNSTGKPLLISVYKRNGNVYEAGVLSMKILPKNQECLYELKSGIYKMKLETEEGGVKIIFGEGELKLNACENVEREIKF